MRTENKVILKRICAFLIDYVIVLTPAIILIAFVFTKLNISSDVGLSFFTSAFMLLMPLNILLNIPFNNAMTLLIITVVSFSIVYVSYCLILELIVGQTLGAKCARIKCVNRNIRCLNKKEILLRNLLKFLLLSCFLIGLITIIFKQRKTLYDIISKTEVVAN